MDPFNNPFAPGAGSRPPELAGRAKLVEDATIACRRSIASKHARGMMLLGLRGTGKTVLLNEIEEIGRSAGFLTAKIEAPEGGALAKLLMPQMTKVMRSLSGVERAKQIAQRGLGGLRNFASAFDLEIGGVGISIEPEPGLADSGDLGLDLPDLFEEIGRAAKAGEKGWLLLIDEVQYLSESDLSALIVALHHISQKRLPVLFFGAGLPLVAKLAGDAKSYAERLFTYPPIGALGEDAARDAIAKPIREEEAEITDDALDLMVSGTQGYPFFLQEWGAQVWDLAEGPKIGRQDAEAAQDITVATLDQGFFKVRSDRLTRKESEFVLAMARLGDGPYPIGDIANALGKTTQALGPIRASIIRKGMIYGTEHGMLDFTVPLYAEHIRRQNARQEAEDES
jgi:hypothetical protein